MKATWEERQAALRAQETVPPAWWSLTLGQYLEGCAQAAGSPYPLWLLRKYCGYYRMRGEHITPNVPLWRLLWPEAEKSRGSWEMIYQLLVEMFLLVADADTEYPF